MGVLTLLRLPQHVGSSAQPAEGLPQALEGGLHTHSTIFYTTNITEIFILLLVNLTQKRVRGRSREISGEKISFNDTHKA